MDERELNTHIPLPKTPPAEGLAGAVCAQYKRCGKPNCRCARGELHGPYFYRFRWRGGRVVKEYVPLSRVEEVRVTCELYRERRSEARADDAFIKQLLAALKAKVKELSL